MKTLIKNCEYRMSSYKSMLEDIYKNKTVDYPEWYKEILREGKNHEKILLKELIAEKTNENEGLNPPYFYH